MTGVWGGLEPLPTGGAQVASVSRERKGVGNKASKSLRAQVCHMSTPVRR